MNAILEATVGIALFIVIIAFTTSRIQDIFLANAQEAFYESLKQRGYAISSFIKLWLENLPHSYDSLCEMNEEDFQRIFIYRNSMPNVVYYIRITALAEISRSFSHSKIAEEPFPPIERGNKKIWDQAVRVIDIAKVQNTLWLIEVYLWVG